MSEPFGDRSSDDRLAPWWMVAVMTAALAMIAVGSLQFPNELIDEMMVAVYTASATALIWWSVTLTRCALVVFGALLFAASLFRAASFAWLFVTDGVRLSGIGFNVMMMLFAWRFTRSDGRCGIS